MFSCGYAQFGEEVLHANLKSVVMLVDGCGAGWLRPAFELPTDGQQGLDDFVPEH